MKRNNGSSAGPARNGTASQRALGPPTFNATVAFRKRFRYTATNAGSSLITARKLIGSLVVATSATVGNPIVQSVRIRNVSIWGPMSSSLAPVTVSVEYPQQSGASGAAGPSRIQSDTSMGAMKPAFVSYAPPQDSLQHMWLNDNTDPVLKLVYPAGAVIDIDLDLVLHDDGANGTTITIAGATAGVLYLAALDNPTGNLIPVSFPTA